MGAAESAKYPSRMLLWNGKPKLIGEADRAPSPPPVAETGEADRDMNGLRTDDVIQSLFPSNACARSGDGDGELASEEDDDTEVSSTPSVVGGADFVLVLPVDGGLGPAGFPALGVN